VAQYGRVVRRRAKLEFDVLTDLHLRVAEAFGLAFTLPTALKELYAAFGNALDKFYDEPAFRLPMPARYVLDQRGRIRAADVRHRCGRPPAPGSGVEGGPPGRGASMSTDRRNARFGLWVAVGDSAVAS